MKKILSMLLVFAMMFGLLACGASKPAEACTVCSAAGSSTCRCPASRRRSCVPSPRA